MSEKPAKRIEMGAEMLVGSCLRCFFKANSPAIKSRGKLQVGTT